MTKEEVKEMYLKDEEQAFKVVVAAQFTALYEYLVAKGILTKEDIDKINTLTDKYTNAINELAIDKIMEGLEKESE